MAGPEPEQSSAEEASRRAIEARISAGAQGGIRLLEPSVWVLRHADVDAKRRPVKECSIAKHQAVFLSRSGYNEFRFRPSQAIMHSETINVAQQKKSAAGWPDKIAIAVSSSLRRSPARDGWRLPEPMAGELFDAWRKRASSVIAKKAEELRRRRGIVGKVSAVGKGAKSAAIAAGLGYAFAAIGVRMLLRWGKQKGKGQACGEFSKTIDDLGWGKLSLLASDNAQREAAALNDPKALLPEPRSERGAMERATSFSDKMLHSMAGLGDIGDAATVSAMVLAGVATAPLTLAAATAVAAARNEKAMAPLADALARASEMMACEDDKLGFGKEEIAMAGWLAACQAGALFGASSGLSMLSALACRAASRPGEPLGAIPSMSAGWRGASLDRELAEASLSKPFAAEAFVAQDALWKIVQEGSLLASNAERRILAEKTLGLLSSWMRDAPPGAVFDSCPESDSVMNQPLQRSIAWLWLGEQDGRDGAVTIDGLGADAVSGADKLRAWAREWAQMSASQAWPAEMKSKMFVELAGQAILIEARGDKASSRQAMPGALKFIQERGPAIWSAAESLGLSEAEMSSAFAIGCQYTHKVRPPLPAGCQYSETIQIGDCWVYAHARPEPEHLMEETRRAWEVAVLAQAAPARTSTKTKTSLRL